MKNFFLRICTHETDPPEVRRRKVSLVIISCFCSITAVAVSILVIYLSGPGGEGYLLLLFALIVGTAIVMFVMTRRFNILLYTFLFSILFTPFLVQWLTGGFKASGATALWGMLAPFGSLMFLDFRRALLWFGGYLTLLIFSIYTDGFSCNLQNL